MFCFISIIKVYHTARAIARACTTRLCVGWLSHGPTVSAAIRITYETPECVISAPRVPSGSRHAHILGGTPRLTIFSTAETAQRFSIGSAARYPSELLTFQAFRRRCAARKAKHGHDIRSGLLTANMVRLQHQQSPTLSLGRTLVAELASRNRASRCLAPLPHSLSHQSQRPLAPPRPHQAFAFPAWLYERSPPDLPSNRSSK
jgi:hypothetical protein